MVGFIYGRSSMGIAHYPLANEVARGYNNATDVDSRVFKRKLYDKKLTR
jgi:hypothetical protein